MKLNSKTTLICFESDILCFKIRDISFLTEEVGRKSLEGHMLLLKVGFQLQFSICSLHMATYFVALSRLKNKYMVKPQ